jgi:transcriptional regulator with XRE-family HTH domain
MAENKIKLKSAWSLFDEYCDETMNERVSLYDIYYEISTKIYDYRMENGLSQKKLAEILGVTQAMVSKLESGEYNYTIEQLWKITKKLGWKLNIGFEGTQQDNYSVGYDADNQVDSKISLYSLEAV